MGGLGGTRRSSRPRTRALEAGRPPVRVQVMVPGELMRLVGAHPADRIATGLGLGLRTGLCGDSLPWGPSRSGSTAA